MRDTKVCTYLGLIPTNGRSDYRVDWQVFRSLVNDAQVIEAVDAGARRALEHASAEGRTIRLDVGRLRLLDAALWTWAAR